MLPIIRNKFSAGTPWRRAFIVSLVFVLLASFIFWLDFFRSYQAEVSILIVAKQSSSPLAAAVAGDIKELTRTLTFYERVLADNELIDDTLEGQTPKKRKAFWNDMVSLDTREGSGFLVIRAYGETGENANRIAKQVAHSLFSVAGLYYDVKKDIDMRIVDGPITGSVLTRPWLYVVVSVSSAIIITLLFFGLLIVIPDLIGEQKRESYLKGMTDINALPHPESDQEGIGVWIDPKKFIPAKPDKLSFGNSYAEFSKEKTHNIAYAPAHALAPPNLPIDEGESDMFQPEKAGDAIGIRMAEAESFGVTEKPTSFADTESEPTEEEYKKRLNDLLAGGR